MDNDKRDVSTFRAPSSKEAVVRRRRLLWVGLVVYFLIMLNALRYVYVVPYQAIIAGALANMAIIVSLVQALKRAYQNQVR